MPIFCKKYVDGSPSDHFDGSRFFNPGKPMTLRFRDLLRWRLTAQRGPWPQFRPNAAQDIPPRRVYGTELRLSFVGHATVLIQTAGINILTDPIWSDRASPLSWAGPRRVHPPGIDFTDLPPIDAVFISHNQIILHHDSSIPVTAYDWSEGGDLSADIKFVLQPVQHWSARGLFDRNMALWGAYMIMTPAGNIYFAGDTGYGGGDCFRLTTEEFGPSFIALLPIGCSKPEWFMQYQHMGPAEAVKAYYDLGRPFVLPTHHSAFPLADNGYTDPVDNLALALENDGRARKHFLPLAAGESCFFAGRKGSEHDMVRSDY